MDNSQKKEVDIISAEELNLIVENGCEIVKNILCDPLKLALKGVNPIVCNQIKYLQRAKDKLPNYYGKFCIIPSLSYEQSSSEATAKAKDFGGGELAVDLTCGLGVDSYYLSQKFDKVVSVERNETLCEVAKLNFQKLNRLNIEVVNSTAESFLKNNEHLRPNLIYLDPARRDHTKKVFLIEDCSPDMNNIMPLAIKMAKKIAVKLSPMFDVEAARNFFGKYGRCVVESVSFRGECKEVIVIIDAFCEEEDRNNVVIVDNNGDSRRYTFDFEDSESVNNTAFLNDYKYLYVPDVAFYKSRTVNQLFRDIYHCECYYMFSNNSPVFANEKIDDFEGDCYTIEESFAYKPKDLKKIFKKYGSKSKILKKDFKFSTEQIKKELSIKDGAYPVVMFTNKRVYFLSWNYYVR